MMELQPKEVLLQLSRFQVVGVHIFFCSIPFPVNLLDDKHGIAIYHESLDAEEYSKPGAMKDNFVFGLSVGDRKLDLEDILELLSNW